MPALRLTFCLLVTLMSSVLSLSPALADYIGAEACGACHEQQWQNWQGSHHQLATAEATSSTVLGDFEGSEIQYNNILSRFTKRGDNYYVTTDNAEGELEEFRITHTFGWDPLQQYLISFEDGRKQALNLAWDSRPESEGGQRWFNLYPEDDIEAGDLLHWTAFPFTWNTSCASCHSTNLQKNYDIASNSFDTTWSEINVACEACHGEGSEHLDWSQSRGASIENAGFPWSLETAGGWAFTESGSPIASRIGAEGSLSAEGSSSAASASFAAGAPFEQQVCAQCHSLRTELQPFMGSYHDSFQLSAVAEPLYHIDGQIREEVFVMGSFAQSRMHDMGVTCSNCHDPHSLKLLAEPNQVCAQCHLPTRYNTPEHHFHELETAGAICVDCHMPASNFMVIDARRDHNIRIPRPDLSEEMNTPNACNQCHTDQSVEWAADHFENWWPDIGAHYSQYLVPSEQSETTRLSRLFSVLSEPDTNSIARYRVLQEVAQSDSPSAYNAIRRYSRSSSTIERQGAIEALAAFPLEQSKVNLFPLLNDEFLSVRLAATRQLATLDINELNQDEQARLNQAITETENIMRSQLDSPGNAMQLSNLYSALGDTDQALRAVEQALVIATDWMPALINQAALLSSVGDEDAARASLRRAISANPDQGAPYYSLGLSQIRTGERDAALLNLERAASLSEENPHYSYVYGIALYESGRTQLGVDRIFETYQANPNQTYIGIAAASYQIQLGQLEAAQTTSQLLQQRSPENPQVQQIVEYLNQVP